MDADELFRRYRELQDYLDWADVDAGYVRAAAGLLAPCLPALIDDFYAVIERHPNARKVITGGPSQIDRLKGTLLQWVGDLFSGRYDADYVARRWRVGWRHVEIGLDQVYTNVALSRIRTGLIRALQDGWTGDPDRRAATVRALNKLLDLDLAILEDAYQAESNQRLQRTERLATIGQVAGGVAHELRNPLNVVKTSVSFLRNARNPTPEKKAEHLRRIERHVELADGVITALTNFARLPVPDLRPVALEPCLREALEANPPGGAIQVTLDCPPALPPALADAAQLRIVFGNLIRNARDVMPGGGRLRIAARRADDRIEVAVGDTGVGIAAEDLARIMEPLYSTKPRGLGLAIARAILDKIQGGLRVTSEPERGSTFTVWLGAAASEAEGDPAR